jgi:coenzyme F420-0:L-glutamate ligase/coenzyme F420-1:gamma-L-glutamate ligase
LTESVTDPAAPGSGSPDFGSSEPDTIIVFAPAGVGEVGPTTDLAAEILAAVAGHPSGPVADGDIVVVTSKILSKAEGRSVSALSRAESIAAENVRTVARRGETVIARTRHGLTVAAAGVDNSNVAPGTVLLLPTDPDASARKLRAALQQASGRRVGVIVSDTAGLAWRNGQTDHAIGASGVVVSRSYAGRTDAYGNPLQVTEMAVADELAAAGDLVKAKLAGRPVAVVRGLAHLVTETTATAVDLVRDPRQDMFGLGSTESVLAAALVATGQIDRYEELVALDPRDRSERLLTGTTLPPAAADLLRALLSVDLSTAGSLSASG